MASLAIEWTTTAYKQRNVIFEYWNSRNGNTRYSKQLLVEINKRLKTISKFPNSGKQSSFDNTRVISMGYHSIFYKIYQDRIIITAFWDNRDDPNKLT